MNEEVGYAAISPKGGEAVVSEVTHASPRVGPSLFGTYNGAPFVRQMLIVGCVVFPLFMVYPFALRASMTGGVVPVAAVVIALTVSALAVFCVTRFYRKPSLEVSEEGLLYQSATKAHRFSWEEVAQAHIPYHGYDLSGTGDLMLQMPERDGKLISIPFQSFPQALPVFAEIAHHVPFEPKPEVRSDLRIVLPVSGKGKTAVHFTASGVIFGDGARAEQVAWSEINRIELVQFCAGSPAFETLTIHLPDCEVKLQHDVVGRQTVRNWGGGLPAQLILASILHLAPADKIERYCLVGPSPLPVPPEIRNMWVEHRRNKASRGYRGLLFMLLGFIVVLYAVQIARLQASDATPTLLTYFLLGLSLLYFSGFVIWQMNVGWRSATERIRVVEQCPNN